MGTVVYSSSLLELAATPESLTPSALWRALSKEERAAALVAALNDKHLPWLREYLAQELVRRLRGFRLATVLRWSSEELARAAAKQPVERVGILRQALVALHLPARSFLQAAFFDQLGIPHDEGILTGELPEPVGPAEQVWEAAQRLVERYPGDRALTYLLAVRSLFPDSWSALDPWLREFAGGRRPRETGLVPQMAAAPAERVGASAVAMRAAEADREAATMAAAVSRVRIESDRAEFTALDDQLTIMIVNAASGVANAATESQVDDVVNEFVKLNGQRHQSFHHAGFRDALFGREPAASLPAQNEYRWRWYYAGFVVGLARQNRLGDIAALYDRCAVIRGLGDTGLGPSAHGGRVVFEALCDAGRYAEASRFVSADAVYNNDAFARQLLDKGTDLLRREDPATATPIFETLWRGLADRLADGLAVPPEIWIPVRRRRAHCLRYADDPEGARALLEELLDEPDDENRAAVLADLGLLDAGFRRLHELRYPHQRGDVAGLREALERGRPRFVEAIEIPARTAAHGHYALGFLELLGTNYARAVVHLEQALAGFGQRPEIYRGGNLLMSARLHLGLALCLALADVTQLHRAGRLLREAMEGGERIPPYLIGDVLDALAFADRAAAEGVAEDVLAAGPNTAVDEVARAAAALRCRAAADALVQRARDTDRSLTERTRDWHLALPMLIAQGRAHEAAEALDSAEEAAMQGILRADFLDLLRDEARYGPVWTVDDARWSHVRVLEAAGDYTNAAGFLQQVFQLALARGDAAAENSAREVLERLEDYPAPFRSLLAELRDQFTSRFPPEPTPAGDMEAGERIRILVVGGNETQKRFDERLAQTVREVRPGVELEFLHSGWTSNWGAQIEEFERRLSGMDGVVFSRYMRTGFGEQARKRLGTIPWRGCGGRGQGAFANTILALAAEVQRIRAACSERRSA